MPVVRKPKLEITGREHSLSGRAEHGHGWLLTSLRESLVSLLVMLLSSVDPVRRLALSRVASPAMKALGGSSDSSSERDDILGLPGYVAV